MAWYDPLITIIEQAISTVYAKKTDLTTHNTNNSAHCSLFNSKEDTSNKVTSLSSSSTHTQYISAKGVFDHVEGLIGDVDYWLLNGSDNE